MAPTGGRGGDKKGSQGSATPTLAVCFSWGSATATTSAAPDVTTTADAAPPNADGNAVTEVFRLFTEFVVELKVAVKQGRLCLEMIVLPPWEREAARLACPKVPTTIVEEA